MLNNSKLGNMAEKEQFDLLQFMTDSLSVQVNANPSTRMTYGPRFEDPHTKMLNQDPSDFLQLKNWEKTNTIIPKEEMETPILQFFNGVNVFITGGTGFLGKILTEKLIRSVPTINNIYLLVRAKRGKQSQKRFDELFQEKLFERMRAEVPHFRSKVTLVEGDLSMDGLGLSPVDRFKLTSLVQVVFHSAADVRFIEPLKSSITSNVLGSLRVLDLAKEMINLKSFVHVSTAYSQCILRRVPEAVPKLPISYKEILNLIESKSEEEVEKERFKIMMGWPSSYTFGKAVCEDMIQEESLGMPICIFRPAVVGSTYKEPVRGWTDNIYGPTGIFVGSGLGVVHSFLIYEECCLDFVPVDYVINGLIAASWKNQFTRHVDSIRVYNFVLPDGAKKNWKTMVRCAINSRDKFPFENAIYFATTFVTSSYFVDEVCFWLLHKIPGMVIDKVLVFSGEKPRLSRVFDKLRKLKRALRFFLGKTWEFDNENLISLWESLTSEDKAKFNFDMADFDLQEHFNLCKLGVRYFYLKQEMKSIPKAEIRNKWFKWTHYSLKAMFGILLLKGLVVLSHSLPI